MQDRHFASHLADQAAHQPSDTCQAQPAQDRTAGHMSGLDIAGGFLRVAQDLCIASAREDLRAIARLFLPAECNGDVTLEGLEELHTGKVA